MFAPVTALALVLSSLAGVPAPPVEAPVAAVQTVDTHWAADAMSERIWLSETLNVAGVVIPEHITVIFTDTDNCGSEISFDGTGGGCTVTFTDGTVSVLVSPTALEIGTGKHILFHELGHAMHNLRECAAEYYAHTYSDPDIWSYPECAV